MTENLTEMGADVIDTDDGFIINSRSEESIPVLHGAEINCSMDHRIAMTFAIAGLNADGETIITDSDCVDVSYPGFFAKQAIRAMTGSSSIRVGIMLPPTTVP